jgi:hypothetical protein
MSCTHTTPTEDALIERADQFGGELEELADIIRRLDDVICERINDYDNLSNENKELTRQLENKSY